MSLASFAEPLSRRVTRRLMKLGADHAVVPCLSPHTAWRTRRGSLDRGPSERLTITSASARRR